MNLERGTQIVYVPRHAQYRRTDGTWTWDPDHPDVERGFVMSQRGEFVFCRYWHKGEPGNLRTRANSEATPLACIRKWKSVRAGRVWETIQCIEKMEAQP